MFEFFENYSKFRDFFNLIFLFEILSNLMFLIFSKFLKNFAIFWQSEKFIFIYFDFYQKMFFDIFENFLIVNNSIF